MFALDLGGGLALRLHEARHAGELYELIDRNREHLAPWFPWVETTRGPEDSRAFIEGGLRRFASGNGFEAGVIEHGRLVGGVGLHYVARPEDATEVGYWLAGDAQGRGLMSRAIAGLLHHLFDELDLNRVEIRCDPANARSRAVPERLGFEREGVLRAAGVHGDRRFDHVVYGLLRDAWRAGRAAAS
ncbi:MAG: GNAT family N-acetyltransferase [Deinococcus-Thermus bacterium]|jgi:ribosomal-protein-serine acetyltransferase|nr:GNAT family N-acetyltransferase [Deinococcota bacterium]